MFPVVGIGASAGGLSALRKLFSSIPADSGQAYVVVVHLAPDHKSHLAEILQPHVNMPVIQVNETMKMEPNCVYLIPPNANLESIDTHLRLSQLEPVRQDRAPIDHFFRTLAKNHESQAVGVILTGTGTDGTLGMRKIKEAGGLTVVQSPDTAEYDGMPRSALSTGLIDLVLPLEKIPETLLAYAHTYPHLELPENDELAEDRNLRALQGIFSRLAVQTRRDFTHYKRSTILRRIARRMQWKQIEELPQYVRYLDENPEETSQLADDLLVNVTSFFRDPEVFEALEKEVLPQLFANRPREEPVRIWSVGCATGEEAYSLAMLVLEYLDHAPERHLVQIFASDMHEQSLKNAREGFYPGEIEADVSRERLTRFFQEEEGGYRVRKELREIVVFAPHNFLSDPPFSRIDLVSCRNVLIYLDSKAQREVTELFHYALRPDGLVLVGTSETIEVGDLFISENKKCCLYRKREINTTLPPHLGMVPFNRFSAPAPVRGQPARIAVTPSFGGLHSKMVEMFAPPSILVSPDDQIVHLSSHAGRFLVHPGGELTANLFKVLREEFRFELRTLIPSVRQRREGLSTQPIALKFDGDLRQVVIRVRPSMEPNEEGFVLIIFDEGAITSDEESRPKSFPIDEGENRLRQQHLIAELELTQLRLQSIIQEYETSQEKLRASNEELQSANEELRSMLEELETSKEELQSMNEELQTVNQENRHKVDELAQLSSDLQNLLTATEIATLFLDRELRIARFTPKVTVLFNVRMTDRGRPLSDFSHRLGYPELHQDAKRVLEKLIPIEREVQDESQRWYLSRVLPYRSTDDRIEGVVITFVDITARKIVERDLHRHMQSFTSLVEQVQDYAIFMIDQQGHGTSWNEGVRRVLGFQEAEFIGRDLSRIIYTPEDIASGVPQRELQEAANTGRATTDRWMRRQDGSYLHVAGITTALHNENRELIGFLKVMRDHTEQKILEDELKRTAADLVRANSRKDEFLATLAHELRNPLAPLKSGIDLLRRNISEPVLLDHVVETMYRQLNQLITLVDDLMDVSRINCGKLRFQKSKVALADFVHSAVEATKPFIEQKRHHLEVLLPEETILLEVNSNRMAQVLSNLLNNAAKYTPEGGNIQLAAVRRGENVEISITDSGIGIPPEMLGRIFDIFTQLENPLDRFHSGLGIGLTLVKSLVELHGGHVEVFSEGVNRGAKFVVILPRPAPSQDSNKHPSLASASITKPRRLLIVDDNEAAAFMLTELLRQLGQDVRTSNNGTDAFQLASAFQPEMILLDLGMPNVDGFEVCRRIRAQPWGKNTTIVAITGWGQSEDRQRTHDAGFNEHLVKPVSLDAIVRLLENLPDAEPEDGRV